MAVIWPTFINNVKGIVLNEMPSETSDSHEGGRTFGRRVSEEYDSAIKMAMSPFGELWGGNGVTAAFTTSYEDGFEALVVEGEGEAQTPGKEEKDKIECSLDENGNEIPGSGKECDPEFNDPDTEMPETPPIDPEKLREFVKEYKDEYDLHEFIYFEFHVEEREKETVVTEHQDGSTSSEIVYGDIIHEGIHENSTRSHLSDIIATRLLVQFESLSKSKKKKLVNWIETFKEEPDSIGFAQENSYFNNVEKAIKDAGHTSRHSNGRLSLVMDVYIKVISALEASYGTLDLTDLIDDDDNPQPIIYPFEGRELHIHIAQVPADQDNPEIPEILDKYFITYFSFDESDNEAWNFKNSKIESDYLHPTSENQSELKKEWFKCPSNLDGATQEDIANATGGTLFMLTRQELLDALEEQEEDEEPSEDPYEMIAQATIDYWKSTAVQPLKSMPAAPPALISSPLGGKYVGVYYGSMKTLAADVRKALNSGKAFKEPSQKTAAATAIATNLSVAYAKHLLQLKFIYLGGIPTPGGPVPMVGFVPFVS